MVNTMNPVADPEATQSIAIGTRVDVRSRFVGAWARGFEIAEQVGSQYIIKRLSDSSVLPDLFDAEDVRVERRKQSQWWY